MLCRATQDGQVIVESSDKTWSTEEGNGKPLQYFCLENPMNCNQSILKEINPEYSLEGLMLKLKFQYFSHLTADSLEKTLMLERLKAEGEEGRDSWMASPIQWT